MVFPKRVIERVALLSLLALAACESDTTDPGGDGGSISMTLSASALSIVQGANGSVTATVVRAGDFTGAIAISVDGLPNNVTATANPASIAAGATSSTITFAAASGATPGNSTITIRATGTGVSDQTGAVTLTVTAAAQPDFTMVLNPAAVSIQQNGQGASAANLTRTNGFAGGVTFSATGAPAGMTVSFDPASTTSNTTAITVVVGAAVAVNTYPITIHGAATGIAEKTAVLNVTVTAAPGGSGNTTYRFCQTQVLFAAYQDGNGPWTALNITNSTVSFNIASGRGGIAYVTSPNAGQYQTVYLHGTQADLNNGAVNCPAPPTTKTVNATVANVGATEYAYVGLGTALQTTTGAQPNLAIQGVRNGVTDLVATRVTSTFTGAAGTQVANKAIIRRGIDPAANSTLPVLDFNAAEAFNPVMRNLTVNNLGADQLIVTQSFTTAAGGISALYSQAPGDNLVTRQIPTIPNTQAGDLHLISLLAGTLPFSSSRALAGYFTASADRTFTLGPQLSAVTVTTAATSPNARLRAQYTLQSEYDDGVTINYSQGTGATHRFVIISFTGGYLGSATTLDHTQGDLTGLTGWNNTWGLSSGLTTQWVLVGVSGTGIVGSDGSLAMTATRIGTITP